MNQAQSADAVNSNCVKVIQHAWRRKLKFSNFEVITAKELSERYPESSIPIRDDADSCLQSADGMEVSVEGEEEECDDNEDEEEEFGRLGEVDEMKEVKVENSYNDDGNSLMTLEKNMDNDDGFIAFSSSNQDNDATNDFPTLTSQSDGTMAVKGDHMIRGTKNSKHIDRKIDMTRSMENTKSKVKSKSKTGVSKMLSASHFLSKFTAGYKRKQHEK